METYYTKVNGETVSITLHSLAEYEANGGEYDDTGNGGERFEENERSQFLAAMTLGDDLTDRFDLLPRDIGLAHGAGWFDTTTGYWLLRDWPTSAPLAARCGVS